MNNHIVSQTPLWLLIPYIHHGYKYTKPWTTFHNETINGYTMLIALLIGASGLTYGLLYHIHNALPFIALFLGQALHHPISIIYHFYKSKDIETFTTLRNLDISMILVMNTCATLALSWFILTPIGAIFAFLCVCFITKNAIKEIYASPSQNRRPKILKYIAMSMLGYYIPIIGKGVYDVVVKKKYGYMLIAIIMIVLHGISGLLYITHFPERVLVKYNHIISYVGTSHNIMHILSCIVMYNIGYMYLACLSST